MQRQDRPGLARRLERCTRRAVSDSSSRFDLQRFLGRVPRQSCAIATHIGIVWRAAFGGLHLPAAAAADPGSHGVGALWRVSRRTAGVISRQHRFLLGAKNESGVLQRGEDVRRRREGSFSEQHRNDKRHVDATENAERNEERQVGSAAGNFRCARVAHGLAAAPSLLFVRAETPVLPCST